MLFALKKSFKNIPYKNTKRLYNVYTMSVQCRNVGGTGMIASSSTFRPHPGRDIRHVRDLFRLLNAVRHCTEAF